MRQWPPPQRSWILTQTWRDLLFAHWPVPAGALARVVPPALELDSWEGKCWIGIVPFRMDRIYPRGTFPVPRLSASPELNVRTYVKFGGKPGVFFLSLDAANVVAVKIARRFFHLPYVQARMKVSSTGPTVHFSSSRIVGDAEFRASYGPLGPAAPPLPETIEHWLTERYCFYALDPGGNVIRGEIDHSAWPLQPTEASIELNTMTAPFDIRLPDTPPLLHFSRKIEVKLWMPERA